MSRFLLAAAAAIAAALAEPKQQQLLSGIRGKRLQVCIDLSSTLTPHPSAEARHSTTPHVPAKKMQRSLGPTSVRVRLNMVQNSGSISPKLGQVKTIWLSSVYFVNLTNYAFHLFSGKIRQIKKYMFLPDRNIIPGMEKVEVT